MKIKFLLALFVLLAIVAPLILKGPDGKPIMSVGDWLPSMDKLNVDVDKITDAVDQLQSIAESMSRKGDSKPLLEQGSTMSNMVAGSAQLSSSSGKMYQWQDEQGRWHFSNQKPVEGVQARIVDLPEIENVMEAPVIEGENSSKIQLPGGFNLGQ